MSDVEGGSGTFQSVGSDQFDIARAFGRARRRRRMAMPLEAPVEETGKTGVWNKKNQAEAQRQLTLKQQRARAAKFNRLRAPARGYNLVVTGSQGGAGKTTLSALLATQLAIHHGAPVALVESNLGAGAASLRLGLEPVATASQLAHTVDHVMRLADIQDVALHSPDGLDLVVSDDNMALTDWVSPKEYLHTIRALKSHYSVILTDTSSGLGSPYTKAAMEDADQIIFCCTADADAGAYIVYTLDCLSYLYPDFAESLILVISEVRPGTLAPFMKFAPALEQRAQAVFAIPYSPLLATGGAVSPRELPDEMLDRYLDVSVELAESFSHPRPKPEALQTAAIRS